MPTVTWLMFESPLALSAVLGLLLFGLLAYWRRGGRGRYALVGLGVTVVLLTLQGLVVTRREHADRILRSIEKELVASRVDALAAALAEDFDAGAGLDRQAFLDLVDQQLARVRIRWLDRMGLRVRESERESFNVVASYRADVDWREFAGSIPSEWLITFGRRAKRWQITAIRPLSLAGEENVGWGFVDRASRLPHRRVRS